jgi:arylsulfatase A-like enzyme
MSDRPNVLVVLTDQQRWDTTGPYTPMDLTPNLDRAAERGTRFDQTISNQPVCGPARGCLQTGQYATTHGVWSNGIPLAADRTMASAFRDAGYDTGYVGKWHLGGSGTDPSPPDTRSGYNYWRGADAIELTSHPYEGVIYDEDGDRVAFDGYRVDAMTDLAEEFVRRERDDPFFCFLSFLEPHQQNDLDYNEAYGAPDGYARRFREHWVPPDLEGQPGHWQHALPDYYGMCRRIDECYGRLLDALESDGLREDTIVLFTSDHGCLFEAHPEGYKRSAREGAARVPGVVTGPGFDGGEVVSDPVGLVDFPPTLLDAAGVAVPEAMEGESLLPVVSGGESREDVFVQISESKVGRALRTDRWTYVVRDPEMNGSDAPSSDRYVEQYLFDLEADPYQQRNLAGHDRYRDVADELRDRLRERIETVEGETPAIEPPSP